MPLDLTQTRKDIEAVLPSSVGMEGAVNKILNSLITQLETAANYPASNRSIPFAQTSGTNAYTATIDGIDGYVLGDHYLIRIMSASTGASSLNISSKGVRPIVKNANQAILSGDLKAGQIYLLCFDGNNLQVVAQMA